MKLIDCFKYTIISIIVEWEQLFYFNQIYEGYFIVIPMDSSFFNTVSNVISLFDISISWLQRMQDFRYDCVMFTPTVESNVY